MNISLKSMTLEFFKGVKNLTVDFHQKTEISGRNGTGKTTVYDAFLWLLFGKDSSGSANFQIKTIDNAGVVIPNLDHRVCAAVAVGDGVTKTLSRTLRERWQKPRGQAEAVFVGHETIYAVDGIEVKAKDFNTLVAEWCEESVFRLVTDVAAFFRLKTAEQRQILLAVAGDVAPEELTEGKPELAEILPQITGVGYDNFKKSIRSKIRPIQKELDGIPSRIEELVALQRQIEDDPKEVNAGLQEANQVIESTEKQLQDVHNRVQSIVDENKVHFESIDRLQAEKAATIAKIKAEHQQETLQQDAERNAAKTELAGIHSKMAGLMSEKETALERVGKAKEELEFCRKTYEEKRGLVFVPTDQHTHCHVCRQQLPNSKEKIEALEKRFNAEKAKGLESLKAAGEQAKQTVEALEDRIAKIDAEHIALFEASTTLVTVINDGEGVATLFNEPPNTAMLEADFDAKIQAEKAKIKTASNASAADKLNTTLRLARSRKSAFEAGLSRIEARDKYGVRITELNKQQRQKGQAIADLEKQEFLAETIQRNGSSIIERRINTRLLSTGLSFRLFRDLINGGQEDVCECLVNGVPYHSANTAAQINAGVALVGLLQNHFDCVAPVFIDRAESVNELLQTGGQMIKLTVTQNEFKTTKF